MSERRPSIDAVPANSTIGTRRARQLVVLVVAVSALYELGYLWTWYQHTDAGNDFAIFWSAAHWFVERGLTPPLYDLDVFHAYQNTLPGGTIDFHPLPYPPTLVPFLTPLAWLPLDWADTLFMTATLMLFLLLTAGAKRARVLALLSAPATLTVLIVGQIAFLSSGLLLGGLRQVERRPWLAGVLLGLLSFKPQLGLLVPVALVAFRAWRTFAAATAVTLLLPIPSLLLGGTSVWGAWLHLMPVIAAHLSSGNDVSLQQMVSPTAALLVAGVPLHVAELIQIPVSLAVAAVAYVVCRRYGPSEMTVAMLGVGTLLVTPYAWFYDLVIVAYATAVLCEDALRTGFRQWELPALLLAWVLPLFVVGRFLPGLAPLALLVLFALLVRRVAIGTGPAGAALGQAG